MKFNKLFIPIFLSFVLILGITQPVVAAVKTSEGISNKVFRLHILANSDSTEDQNIKLMLKNHEGAIVNVSSMWGQTGASCEIAYSMSKAAVIGLTRSLAEELAPSGITVNCVCPGIIDTRMNNMFDKNELEEEVPLGRLGTSEEVADAIFYLTQNKYITAQILGVNGGII